MTRRATSLADQISAQIAADPARALEHIQRARQEIESRHAEESARGLEAVPEPKPITEEEIAALVPQTVGVSEERYRAYRFENYLVPSLIRAGFEKRYHVDGLLGTLEDKDQRKAKQAEAAVLLRMFLKGTGAIVVMPGPRGTGKTTIAAQIVIERLWKLDAIASDPTRRGCPCWDFVYRKMTDLIAKLKAHYGEFGTIETERLEAYIARLIDADLLIIDELSEARDDGRHKDRILADIIDKRYSAKKDTVLITNQTTEAFYDTTNPSVLSRLEEHGGVVPCEWGSFRG